MARAVAKQRRKKAAKSAANRPKAPRSEAQLAAGRANIAKAQAAKAAKAEQAAQSEPLGHPADANRPKAFFTFGAQGEKRAKGEKASEPGESKGEAKAARPDPKALTLDEMRSFREKLIALLVSLWEWADKGLTLTALLDGEEAFIWRSIDDADTAFLADRVLAKGRENPFVGAQVRAVIDHWQDARMTMILGPKVLESAGWYQARGLKLAFLGVEVPPKAQRPRRSRGSNGHHAGQPGATQPYSPTGTEGAMYGAQ